MAHASVVTTCQTPLRSPAPGLCLLASRQRFLHDYLIWSNSIRVYFLTNCITSASFVVWSPASTTDFTLQVQHIASDLDFCKALCVSCISGAIDGWQYVFMYFSAFLGHKTRADICVATTRRSRPEMPGFPVVRPFLEATSTKACIRMALITTV